MSALGHKRPLRSSRFTSAMGHKRTSRHLARASQFLLRYLFARRCARRAAGNGSDAGRSGPQMQRLRIEERADVSREQPRRPQGAGSLASPRVRLQPVTSWVSAEALPPHSAVGSINPALRQGWERTRQVSRSTFPMCSTIAGRAPTFQWVPATSAEQNTQRTGSEHCRVFTSGGGVEFGLRPQPTPPPLLPTAGGGRQQRSSAAHPSFTRKHAVLIAKGFRADLHGAKELVSLVGRLPRPRQLTDEFALLSDALLSQHQAAVRLSRSFGAPSPAHHPFTRRSVTAPIRLVSPNGLGQTGNVSRTFVRSLRVAGHQHVRDICRLEPGAYRFDRLLT